MCLLSVEISRQVAQRDPASLDAKRFRPLTLTELEATASLGLTRLLTLNGTAVAGEEAVVLEVLLVFSVDLHQCAGNGEAQSLALASVTTTVEIGLDIIFSFYAEKSEGLLYHILQNGRGEIVIQLSLVDRNLACTF